MARDTSIRAYHDIKNNGLLSRLRFQVYDVLYTHGPLTQSEVSYKYFGSKSRPSITPRFAELENREVIRDIGIKKCPYSGRDVALYDVTSNLPKKLERKKKQRCLYCGK